MSRLHDELAKRQDGPMRSPQDQKILDQYQEKVSKFRNLLKNKDFAEYLKLEAEMNDPKIVIAYKCSDPICESLKQKIRDFGNRRRVLEKLRTNGTAGAGAQSHRASR